tara:strand:+ start:821 stop:1108 length:288 start_codon:yes stop_codon:yes gene_type:complete
MADCYTNIYVARFELYPADTPTAYCVGFRAECEPNKRANYWDTQISLADASGNTDQQIVNLAYATLSGSIKTWSDTEMHKSSLIGELETVLSGSS